MKQQVYFCSLRAFFFILKCTIKYINRETLKLHLRNNNFIHKNHFPHLHPHSVRDSNSHGHNWPLDPRYYEDNEWNCIYSCGLNTFQMNMILKRLRQFTLYKKSAKNVNVNMSINSVAVEIIPVALIFGC